MNGSGLYLQSDDAGSYSMKWGHSYRGLVRGRRFFTAFGKRETLRLGLCFSLAVLLMVPQLWAGDVRIFFSPKGGCEEAVLAQIDKAHSYIHVAMYAFTSRYLAHALLRAKERGVDVKVVLDATFDGKTSYSKGEYLRRNGISVKDIHPVWRQGLREIEGVMHHKFAVIDGHVVVTGSYNWTASAERANYENLLVFTDAPSLAAAYEREFQRLWR